jgi:hypothetical protein
MMLSVLNWVGNKQHGYSLCSMFLYINFNYNTTLMLIGTWRITQENSTTTRTKRTLILAN